MNGHISDTPEWLKSLLEPVVTPISKHVVVVAAREISHGDVIGRICKYLAKIPGAIQGQDGSGALYNAARIVAHDFDQPIEVAIDVLETEYNPRCSPPWSEAEIRHKVTDALTKPHDKPRGHLLNAPLDSGKRTSRNDDAASDDESTNDAMPGESRTLDTKNPYAAAQRFSHGLQQAGNRLIYHRGGFKSFRGTHYADTSIDGLRAQLYRYADGSKKPNGEPVHASQHLVSNIADALRAAVHLEDGDMPRWIGPGDHEDRNYIAFHNGLLDVGQFIEEPKTKIQPHTSDWFSVNVLPFDYDADAVCPNWEAFMAQVSAGDETWVAGLAMMFGYLLSSDTSQQKCFLLQGAPRSGKGTIARILREMLGKHNVAAPSLTSLAGEFGLAPMIGKTAAIIGDASSPKGTEATRATEILKGVAGEDAFTVNIKHKDQQTLRLSVRFVILCNQLLDMPDASGALANRMILFPFRESFLGREDLTLERRLLNELPGILQWSLRRLRALRANGKLVQPDSGNQARADFARLSSPVRGFIDDRLVCEPGARVTTADAYNAWRGWCEAEGHQSGSANVFGAKLVAAQPEVRRLRVGPKTCREWAYLNIRLAHNGDLLGHAGPLGHGGAS